MRVDDSEVSMGALVVVEGAVRPIVGVAEVRLFKALADEQTSKVLEHVDASQEAGAVLLFTGGCTQKVRRNKGQWPVQGCSRASKSMYQKV